MRKIIVVCVLFAAAFLVCWQPAQADCDSGKTFLVVPMPSGKIFALGGCWSEAFAGNENSPEWSVALEDGYWLVFYYYPFPGVQTVSLVRDGELIDEGTVERKSFRNYVVKWIGSGDIVQKK